MIVYDGDLSVSLEVKCTPYRKSHKVLHDLKLFLSVLFFTGNLLMLSLIPRLYHRPDFLICFFS